MGISNGRYVGTSPGYLSAERDTARAADLKDFLVIAETLSWTFKAVSHVTPNIAKKISASLTCLLTIDSYCCLLCRSRRSKPFL